jgi:hypothetical protein
VKKSLLVVFVFFVTLSYSRQRSAPGAYAPHPNPHGMEEAAPADRPPLDVLSEDPKLVTKLQKLLPQGTTPQQACSGFKKLGDCVAAMHAAQNLEVPFAEIKSKMTGDSAEKLEKAIQDIKPKADAKAERKKAQKQAERDIPVSN